MTSHLTSQVGPDVGGEVQLPAALVRRFPDVAADDQVVLEEAGRGRYQVRGWQSGLSWFSGLC